jgi:autotransporter-associated beta strand protein
LKTLKRISAARSSRKTKVREMRGTYFLQVVLPFGLAAVGPATLAWAAPPSSNYRLVFADEFNGTSLDTSKWSAAYPSWTMPNSDSTASASMVSVGNGVLTLSATRNGSSDTFTSGSISSYTKYNFTGGYVEARIQLPSTPGSWPAFWGLYSGWPPEADMMEYPLTTDGTSGLANNQYSTNYHYTNSSGNAAAGAGVVNTGADLAGTWHTFGMQWITNTSMAFYLDGNEVQSYTGSSVSQMASMYMLLDYAVGGWPGTPSLTQWPAGFTDKMNVDWVRVWQTNPNNDAPTSWTLDGGGAFGISTNWTSGVPSYGNEEAIFGRVGTAATATISMKPWQLFGGIVFDGLTSGPLAGTTAYSLGSSGQEIQLATTSASGALVQATSASTASQTINASVEAWSNTTIRNDMTGGQTLTLGGGVTGNGQVDIEGVGTIVFSGVGNYTGGTTINGGTAGPGVLRASASSALGTGSIIIGAPGNATTARLEIDSSSALPNDIDFRGRNNSSVGIESISGNNVINGTITAGVGGSTYLIQCDAGTLALAGGAPGAATPGIAVQSAGGSQLVTLQGAGNGMVSGTIRDGSGTIGINVAGPGTWTLSGANTYSGATMIGGGTIRLPSAGVPQPVATYSFENVTDSIGDPIITTGVLAPGDIIVNTGTSGAALNGTVDNTHYVGGGTSGASIISTGKFGNALQLDGKGTDIKISSKIVDMSNSASWTFSAWVQTTAPGSSILSKDTGGTTWTTGNTVFYLGTNPISGTGGALPTGVRYAGGFVQGNTPVADGNWHMVTFSDAGGPQSIYVDGVATTLNYPGMALNDVSDTTLIGYDVDTLTNLDGNSNYAGNLDELNFYNTALSAAQIGQLYTSHTVTIASQYIPSNSPVNITVSGASLDLNGTNQTVGSLAGVAGSTVTLGAGNLTTGGNNGSTVFSGSISGAGGITKLGSGTFTLGGVNSYSGGTTVSAGTLVAGVSNALPSGGALTIQGSGLVQLASGTGLATLTSLAISGNGTLDIGNNHLIVNYGSGASPISSIAGWIASGYADFWYGTGITSSAAQVNAVNYGVAYADSADPNNPAGLPTGQIEIKYTLLGDANLDGVVNGTDFGLLAANFGKSGVSWDGGDFNYDGVVNGTDFGLLASNFGKSASGTAVVLPASQWAALDSFAAAHGLLADVPEPSSGLIFVTLASVMLLNRNLRGACRN